jgi:hypothetical protein
MTYQVANARIWDGSAWVDATGRGKTGQNLVIAMASDFASDPPVGAVGGTGVTLTANASAHTFGAWAQLIASTTFDAAAIAIITNTFFTSATATGSVIEVGIGASGAETAVAQIAVGSHLQYNILIPVQVPSGSRIAARLQSVVTGGKTGTLHTGVIPQIGGFVGAANTDTYGVSTATSRGTNVAASNAWTEITASTTRAYRGAVVVFSASNDTQTNINVVGRLGSGASGSETTLASLRFNGGATENVANTQAVMPFLYVGDIPAGTRLAVNQNSAQTYLDACIIGIPYP